MEQMVLTSAQKALKINLNPNIYGTFAEIGAGQETVRHFFRAGGASGTIAKAMSAYDKDFSDAIYGIESDGRYVTERRLRKMINHEYQLMENRLDRDKAPDRCYFSFANTVATINFAKTFKGHGWIGIRFQTAPEKEANEIILHVRLHENDPKHQQETIGALGVNLIYGAFTLWQDAKSLLSSLYEGVDHTAIEVDLVNFSGPDFAQVDNRLMSLQLVKNGFTKEIYGTRYTNDIVKVILRDSAHLQMMDAKYAAKKGYSTHKDPQPLYNLDDAEKAIDHLRERPFRERTNIAPGGPVTLTGRGLEANSPPPSSRWAAR